MGKVLTAVVKYKLKLKIPSQVGPDFRNLRICHTFNKLQQQWLDTFIQLPIQFLLLPDSEISEQQNL